MQHTPLPVTFVRSTVARACRVVCLSAVSLLALALTCAWPAGAAPAGPLEPIRPLFPWAVERRARLSDYGAGPAPAAAAGPALTWRVEGTVPRTEGHGWSVEIGSSTGELECSPVEGLAPALLESPGWLVAEEGWHEWAHGLSARFEVTGRSRQATLATHLAVGRVSTAGQLHKDVRSGDDPEGSFVLFDRAWAGSGERVGVASEVSWHLTGPWDAGTGWAYEGTRAVGPLHQQMIRQAGGYLWEASGTGSAAASYGSVRLGAFLRCRVGAFTLGAGVYALDERVTETHDPSDVTARTVVGGTVVHEEAPYERGTRSLSWRGGWWPVGVEWEPDPAVRLVVTAARRDGRLEESWTQETCEEWLPGETVCTVTSDGAVSHELAAWSWTAGVHLQPGETVGWRAFVRSDGRVLVGVDYRL